MFNTVIVLVLAKQLYSPLFTLSGIRLDPVRKSQKTSGKSPIVRERTKGFTL